jgi:branched-subunit amino acid transport protein
VPAALSLAALLCAASLAFATALQPALAGVILPELLMTQGQFITTWQDARIYAVAVGVGWYFWRRGTGQAVLGTIVAGMAVYLPLHMGWGW